MVVRKRQIHKVPVLVSCEVIVANVLACGWVVGRTVAVMSTVGMVIGVFLDAVGLRRSDHKDHDLYFGRGS